MRKNYCLFIFIFAASISAQAQSDSVRLFSEKLLLDFPVFDLPYIKYAAEMSYNKRLDRISGGPTNPTVGDYLRSYESPSMTQSLAITKNINATNYYFQNKLWNTWLTPTTKTRRTEAASRMIFLVKAALIKFRSDPSVSLKPGRSKNRSLSTSINFG